MAARIYRINYKSDFILTLHSDAGWMTPFCIKFWTGAPSQAFYAQWDGTTYTHCAIDPDDPTKLTVQFDDHHLPVGDLKYQVAYHFTVEDFPNDTEDEVLNQADITTEIDGEEYQVMLDFTGETAPEIQFSLPAYANEVQRIANEQQRVINEQERITNEQSRVLAEQARVNAESERVTEFNRLATQAETDHARAVSDHATAASDHTRAEQDHTQSGSDHSTAETDHTRAESDHATAASDHTRAEQDHTRAGSDHSTAETDHTRAESDHATAASDHTTAVIDHTQAESDHAATVALNTEVTAAEAQRQANEQARQQAEQQRVTEFETQMQTQQQTFETAEATRQSTFEENEEARDAQASELQTKLENGEVVPALAKDIESWHNSNSKVIDTQTDAVFTAGGNESVNSNEAARIISLVPGSLTAGAASLVSTGFNLLRNATQIGSGQVWYFPVPYLRYGTFGTADENNGMLFTDSDNNNMTPTVYWKALSAGVPTSATDGVAAGYTDFGGYRFYTTPSGHEGEVGYFIVQATRATTCAHIAWSGRYDEYIAVDNASDAGATLALTAILNNLHNNGLMYKVGDVVDSIAFTTTSAVWTRNCDRKQGSDLEWTNTLQEEEGTYLHTATIADMKEDGAMICTNEGIALVVSGKDVSYTDSNATAFTTDYIYYELATPVTGTASGTFSFIIEDWGVIYFTGVTGTVVSIIEYSQNIIDTLRKLATTGINDAMRVIAESLNQLAAENERLKIYAERLEARIEALESNA